MKKIHHLFAEVKLQNQSETPQLPSYFSVWFHHVRSTQTQVCLVSVEAERHPQSHDHVVPSGDHITPTEHLKKKPLFCVEAGRPCSRVASTTKYDLCTWTPLGPKKLQTCSATPWSPGIVAKFRFKFHKFLSFSLQNWDSPADHCGFESASDCLKRWEWNNIKVGRGKSAGTKEKKNVRTRSQSDQWRKFQNTFHSTN